MNQTFEFTKTCRKLLASILENIAANNYKKSLTDTISFVRKKTQFVFNDLRCIKYIQHLAKLANRYICFRDIY